MFGGFPVLKTVPFVRQPWCALYLLFADKNIKYCSIIEFETICNILFNSNPNMIFYIFEKGSNRNRTKNPSRFRGDYGAVFCGARAVASVTILLIKYLWPMKEKKTIGRMCSHKVNGKSGDNKISISRIKLDEI